MSNGMFLIAGATGTTGRVAVAGLLDQGHRVRALVHREDARAERLRSIGAEAVRGDLLDLDEIRVAMKGVDGA